MEKEQAMTSEELGIIAEGDRLHNIKVARQASWLNDLFQEHNLSLKDKQEVMRRVFADIRKKERIAS